MVIPSEKATPDVTFETALLQRAAKAMSGLSSYGKRKSIFHHQSVTYAQFMDEDEAQLALLETIENNVAELEAALNRIEELKVLHVRYAPFRDVDASVASLRSSTYVRYHIGHVAENDAEALKAFLDKEEVPYQLLTTSDYGQALLLASYYEDDLRLIKDIKTYSFAETELPEEGISLKAYVQQIEERMADDEKRIAQIKTILAGLSERRDELGLLYDRIQAKIDRKSLSFESTDHSCYIDGWVRSDETGRLDETLRRATSDFDIEYSDPSESEIPPTALKNNKFVSQFETITNMYSVPNHREIDPNPMMSIWYWIIFGIMMGDIGYGLSMLAIFGLALLFVKPKGSMRKLISVFFYSGITAIIAGILFGSFFGADFDLGALIGNIFDQTWTTTILNPVTDPLIMLGFSLVFGVLHIINGLGLKIALLINRKDYLGAFADGFSWILILVGLLLFSARMFLWANEILGYIGLGSAALGALILLALAGRKSKSIIGKILGGFGAIYGSTSYVSDILSYSRILALSLSSAVIASTMNMLAGMLQGSVVGFIFSLVVYLIGHVFNFAMGLLSAYVHDGRLQYIEFFNKFYEGGGYLFVPFAIRLNRVDEISDLREERR